MVAGAFRSLITLEGTMLQLNPEFNLMDEAKRFAKDHAASFMSVNNYSSLKEAATNELLAMLPAMRRIPRKLDDLSSKLENGEYPLRLAFSLTKQMHRLLLHLSHNSSLHLLELHLWDFGRRIAFSKQCDRAK
ncbi:hypothetical protein HFP67_26330 [Bacillus sp. CB102A.1]